MDSEKDTDSLRKQKRQKDKYKGKENSSSQMLWQHCGKKREKKRKERGWEDENGRKWRKPITRRERETLFSAHSTMFLESPWLLILTFYMVWKNKTIPLKAQPSLLPYQNYLICCSSLATFTYFSILKVFF